MKRILCALLACVLLCACTAAPALREGYYLFALEDSGGSPMYFCLESGGTGYVHAMGQDNEITWTPEGLGDLFADGVVTEAGIEFPDGILCTYSATLPDEYLQPIFRPGFYIPEEGEFDSLMCYAELREDGTGEFSIMGMSQPIEWEPTKFYFGDLIVCATGTGFTVTEGGVDSHFRWVGDALPEGFLPDPPAGVYAVSSIGYRGDMTYYNTLTRDNGYLELNEDKTGTLVFDGESYPFVLVSPEAVFDGWSMLLVDMSAQDTGGPPMVVVYTTAATCPIEADSIAFRLLEGENENE